MIEEGLVEAFSPQGEEELVATLERARLIRTGSQQASARAE